MIRTIATATLRDYIALAPHERIAWHTSDDLIPLSDVSLDAPVRPARNVFCVGRNYLEHANEGARAAGRELKLPSVPTFFTKASTAIAAPGSDLHLDAQISREYDFEAELAVVIGAQCKDVSQERSTQRRLRIYRAQRPHGARPAARARSMVQGQESRFELSDRSLDRHARRSRRSAVAPDHL